MAIKNGVFNIESINEGTLDITVKNNNDLQASISNAKDLNVSLTKVVSLSAETYPRGLTGRGIKSVDKTSSEGIVDTYTITYTDGTTSTFQVTNGQTTDYEDLVNLPTINGTPLIGELTFDDLGIGSDKNYYHVQSSASDTWVITHNLKKYPSVNVINSAGDEVIGDIIYNDLNQVTIKFKGSFKGSATLN